MFKIIIRNSQFIVFSSFKNYLFLEAQMEEKQFTFSRQSDKVHVPQRIVRRMKEPLGFEVKSQFYLRIPDKKQIYLIIFCLVGREGKLTKKIKKVLESLDKGIRQFLQTSYITPNSNNKGINAAFELERLSKTLKFNKKIFTDISNKFHKELIEYPLSVFKLDQCVIFRVLGIEEKNDVDLGESLSPQKIENSRNGFILWEEEKQNSIVLAAFSADAQLGENQVEKKISEEERKIIDQKVPKGKKEEKDQKNEPSKAKHSKKGKKGPKNQEADQSVVNSRILENEAAEKIWNQSNWKISITFFVILLILCSLLHDQTILEGLLINHFPETNVYKYLYGQR